MLESIKAIINARKQNFSHDELKTFVHSALNQININDQHTHNLSQQKEELTHDLAEQLGIPNASDGIVSGSQEDESQKLFDSEEQLHKMIWELLHQKLPPQEYEIVSTKLPSDYPYFINVHSSNFLHVFVMNNRSDLLTEALEKSFIDLTKILDSEQNTILHLAAFYSYNMTQQIIAYGKKTGTLPQLINARNKNGTNPLGMLFLNQIIAPEDKLKIAGLFIQEPSFKINRYLNNKRGMDVFCSSNLKDIGGFNVLHMALKTNNYYLFLLLKEINNTIDPVNFEYPAMNPAYHMWAPFKFIEPYYGLLAKSHYEALVNPDQGYDSDSSGDSDTPETPAWYYKEHLKELGDFIGQDDSRDENHALSTFFTPKKQTSKSSSQHIDLSVLSSPSKKTLTPEQKETASKDILKIDIPHFHGVPFIKGQLTNAERREVGKKFFSINREYIKNGCQSNPRDRKLKTIYSRTVTASCGVENHKMLVDSSDETLDKLTLINELLQNLLVNFYQSDELLNEIKKVTETQYQYKKELKKQYGISQKHGEQMFDKLFESIKKDEKIKKIFLSVLQKYINSFTSEDLMPFFWKILAINHHFI